MDHLLRTPLKGILALTDAFHSDRALQKSENLYKFVWVRSGSLTLSIDHVPTQLEAGEIVPLTPLHHIDILEVEGEYIALLFNSDFYCIYGHDSEVSCSGVLFHGSSEIARLQLAERQAALLGDIVAKMAEEFAEHDNLQEEMLRILLKRFIITCTRMARERFAVSSETERAFDLIRQFYILVDNHFKEKKKVQDYADMLHRSPKTLSNLFAACGLASPLRIVHERILSEARRLLLYTPKSAKEIAALLGFGELAAFSRFFRKMTGKSISEFRAENERE